MEKTKARQTLRAEPMSQDVSSLEKRASYSASTATAANKSKSRNQRAASAVSGGLDNLTADDCMPQTYQSGKEKLPRRQSAADMLGVRYRVKEAASLLSVGGAAAADVSSRSAKRLRQDNPDISEDLKQREGGASSAVAEVPRTTYVATVHASRGNANIKAKQTYDATRCLRASDGGSGDLDPDACCAQDNDETFGPGLDRKAHYGSLIALVGKRGAANDNANCSVACVESRFQRTNDQLAGQPELMPSKSFNRHFERSYPTPNERALPDAREITTGGGRHCSDYFSRGASERLSSRSSSVRNSYCERHALASDKSICSSAQPHLALAEVFSPRLDSFNPEGRQRQEYQEAVGRQDACYSSKHPSAWSERRLGAPHSRSKSADAYPHDGSPASLTGSEAPFISSLKQSDIALSRAFTEERTPGDCCTYYPIPAPRKHYRSFSTGDHLDLPQARPAGRRRPVPLPRIYSGLQKASAKPFEARTAYSTVEDQGTEYQDCEARSWRTLQDDCGPCYHVYHGAAYSNRTYEIVGVAARPWGGNSPNGAEERQRFHPEYPGDLPSNELRCGLGAGQRVLRTRSQSTSFSNASYGLCRPHHHERRVYRAPVRRSDPLHCSRGADASAVAHCITGLSWV